MNRRSLFNRFRKGQIEPTHGARIPNNCNSSPQSLQKGGDRQDHSGPSFTFKGRTQLDWFHLGETMKTRRILGGYEKTMAFLFVAIPALLVLRSILSQNNSGVLPHTVEEYSKPSGSANSATSAFGGLDYSLPFPVYYINMDGSEGRRKHTELLFGGLWDLRRSPAVAGTDSETLSRLLGTDTYQWVTDYIDQERINDAKKAWNEVGCTLSHLTTIRKAYLENHEMVMIIEDDV
jgi:hypothetical protein